MPAHDISQREEGSPSLSVVLPSYKVAPYLGNCIASLLDGAPPAMEIIVVDDGSPDDTGAVAEALAAADPRVRVIHQANAGCPAARNTGLEAARGMYVGFVDPDDVVEPGWARCLLEAGSARRAAIIKGEAYIVLNGRASSRSGMCRGMRKRTPLHWFGWMWSAIYRRDFLLRHSLRFPAGRTYGDDIDFQVRTLVTAVLAGEPIAVCEQAVYRYLRRDDSLDSLELGTAQIDGALLTYQVLHNMLTAHARHLPAEGVGYQYFCYIQKLFVFAMRAVHPEDAAAARQLAERLIRECPAPAELERVRRDFKARDLARAERRRQQRAAGAAQGRQ